MAANTDTGIYEIVNLVNGKRYVGSAADIRKRWNEHKRDLERGDHHSVVLMRAWEKYSSEQFAFRVIERCSRELLIEREQAAIDTLLPEYNICAKAGSTLGHRHSLECRARMSARLIGNQYTKGMRFSPEICARMGAGKVGLKRPPRSPEHCRKISEANKGHRRGLGRKVSEETREKIRQGVLGKRHSLETRRRLGSLTDDQVRQIRDMRVSGARYRVIAAAYGITKTLVTRVCLRHRYEWVD